MLDVMHLDIEVESMEGSVARGLIHANDIGAMIAEDAGNDGKRARLVLDNDGQAGRTAIGLVAPGEIDPIRIHPVGQALAADDVDLDPLALAPEADDAVARNRMA